MKKTRKIILIGISTAFLAVLALGVLVTWIISRPSEDCLLAMTDAECQQRNSTAWNVMYNKNRKWEQAYTKIEGLFHTNSDIPRATLDEFNYLPPNALDDSRGLYFREDQDRADIRNSEIFIIVYIEVNILNIYFLLQQHNYAQALKQSELFLKDMESIFDKSIYETTLYARRKRHIEFLIAESPLINDEKNEMLKEWLNINLLPRLQKAVAFKNDNLVKMLRYQYALERPKMLDYIDNKQAKTKNPVTRLEHKIVGDIILKEHELNYRIYIRRLLNGNDKVPLKLVFQRDYLALLSRPILGTKAKKTSYAWITWLDSELRRKCYVPN